MSAYERGPPSLIQYQTRSPSEERPLLESAQSETQNTRSWGWNVNSREKNIPIEEIQPEDIYSFLGESIIVSFFSLGCWVILYSSIDLHSIRLHYH